MKALMTITQFAAQPGLGFDLVRIYLGIGLFVRGALFVAHPEVLLGYLKTSDAWFVPLAVSHYVAVAHLCGGVLLALGLGTRLAALAQVPALIGAVFFVHVGEGLLGAGQSLEFAALVLCLLSVFSVFGAGKLSLDARLERGLQEQSRLDSLSAPALAPDLRAGS